MATVTTVALWQPSYTFNLFSALSKFQLTDESVCALVASLQGLSQPDILFSIILSTYRPFYAGTKSGQCLCACRSNGSDYIPNLDGTDVFPSHETYTLTNVMNLVFTLNNRGADVALSCSPNSIRTKRLH